MANGGYALYRKGDPATSRAAAQAILALLPALQQAVYAYAYGCGPDGFTDHDLAWYFNSYRSTYRTRRSELTRAASSWTQAARAYCPRAAVPSSGLSPHRSTYHHELLRL